MDGEIASRRPALQDWRAGVASFLVMTGIKTLFRSPRPAVVKALSGRQARGIRKNQKLICQKYSELISEPRTAAWPLSKAASRKFWKTRRARVRRHPSLP